MLIDQTRPQLDHLLWTSTFPLAKESILLGPATRQHGLGRGGMATGATKLLLWQTKWLADDGSEPGRVTGERTHRCRILAAYRLVAASKDAGKDVAFKTPPPPVSNRISGAVGKPQVSYGPLGDSADQPPSP